MSPCLPLRSLAYGGDERVRTAGLLLARQALYQLSYTPTSCVSVRGYCFHLFSFEGTFGTFKTVQYSELRFFATISFFEVFTP